MTLPRRGPPVLPGGPTARPTTFDGGPGAFLAAAAPAWNDFGAVLIVPPPGWVAPAAPDARACLADLRARGLKVLIAGNQPKEAESALRALDLPADFIASSAGWGVSKPDPRFFQNVVEAAGVPAADIAYVGDRVDNDVIPSRAAGMTAVFLRRGPWGWMHEERAEIAQAHLRLRTLDGLGERLASLGGAD